MDRIEIWNLMLEWGHKCVAAERERCAMVCETPAYARALVPGTVLEVGKELVAAIRKGSEATKGTR